MNSTKKPYNLPPHLDALLAIIRTVIDTVSQTPEGIPGGTIYAALMTQGCTLTQFERIMELALTSGKIERRGEFYYPVQE